jgi:hypothetical protein
MHICPIEYSTDYVAQLVMWLFRPSEVMGLIPYQPNKFFDKAILGKSIVPRGTIPLVHVSLI